jgi:hypothetical protein
VDLFGLRPAEVGAWTRRAGEDQVNGIVPVTCVDPQIPEPDEAFLEESRALRCPPMPQTLEVEVVVTASDHASSPPRLAPAGCGHRESRPALRVQMARLQASSPRPYLAVTLDHRGSDSFGEQMRRDRPAIAFAGLVAVTAWAAVLLQLVLSMELARQNGGGYAWGLVMYFGYFTILTNILVAVAVTAPLARPRSRAGQFFADGRVATGVCCAILLVGIAYHVLLRSIWDPQGAQWVADTLLHYVTPGLFLVYWAWLIPKEAVKWRFVPLWCVYPVAYFVYALVRGAWIGAYPYPFIDAQALGYLGVLTSAGALLGAFLFVGAGLVVVARLIHMRAGPVLRQV